MLKSTLPQRVSPTKIQSTTFRVIEEYSDSPATSSDGLIKSTSNDGKVPNTPSIAHDERKAVRFADNALMLKPSSTTMSRPSSKRTTAKSAAKATAQFAGAVVCGVFGCVSYILSKACILDGGGAVTGGKVAVSSHPPQYEPRPRIVAYDQRHQHYSGTGRARVPPGVRVRTAPHSSQPSLGGNRNSSARIPGRVHVGNIQGVKR